MKTKVNLSILQQVEDNMKQTMNDLKPLALLKQDDKTVETLAQEETLKEQLTALKLIKTELVKINNKPSYQLTQQQEINTLLKLKQQRLETIEIYTKAKRTDLKEKEQTQLNIINSLLPKEPNKKELIDFIEQTIKEIKEKQQPLTIKHLGTVIKQVKDKFPTTEGKLIQEIFKQHLK